MQLPPIGFGLGAIFQISNKKISEETISFFREIGCDALEINCYTPKELDYVLDLPYETREGFQHFSLHAPFGKTMYRKDTETAFTISRICEAHALLNFDAICIHPDLIEDWSLITSHPDLPWAVENMDCMKCSGQKVEEMKKLTSDMNFQMVLDLMHCYLLDPTMELAKNMISDLGDRIVEIHLSGAQLNGHHTALCYTKQNEILIKEAVELNLPIILEGVINKMEDAVKELKYCTAIAQKLLKA